MDPIIAVMMVRDEDEYIRHVIEGVSGFADEIMFIDTGSRDGTVDIARECGLSPIFESDLKATHSYVEPLVDMGVWVFGVDGDEIYDREGLERLREQMEDGLFDEAYQVQGQYLHATEFVPGEATARGYLGPPAHTPTKLYNMRNIKAWPNTGDDVLFHVGTRESVGKKMRAEPDEWERSPMRCVHTRFLKRSSLEEGPNVGLRFGPGHVAGKRLHSSNKGNEESKNYRWNYRKGGIVEVELWQM